VCVVFLWIYFILRTSSSYSLSSYMFTLIFAFLPLFFVLYVVISGKEGT